MLKQENTPRLETERLILRKFQHDDLEDVFRIYSDLEVNTFLPWFPLRSMDEARHIWRTLSFRSMKKRSPTVMHRRENVPNGDRLCVAQRHRRRKMLRRPRLRPAQRGLAQGLYERSMPRRIAARKGGGVPFSHRHARCEQPGERRGHEGDRHDLPIFLRRAVAAQEF